MLTMKPYLAILLLFLFSCQSSREGNRGGIHLQPIKSDTSITDTYTVEKHNTPDSLELLEYFVDTHRQAKAK